jgi:hypothetical protein
LSRLGTLETLTFNLSKDLGAVREEQERRRVLINQVEGFRQDLTSLRLLLEERNAARQHGQIVLDSQLKSYEDRFRVLSMRVVSLSERIDMACRSLPCREPRQVDVP